MRLPTKAVPGAKDGFRVKGLRGLGFRGSGSREFRASQASSPCNYNIVEWVVKIMILFLSTLSIWGGIVCYHRTFL